MFINFMDDINTELLFVDIKLLPDILAINIF